MTTVSMALSWLYHFQVYHIPTDSTMYFIQFIRPNLHSDIHYDWLYTKPDLFHLLSSLWAAGKVDKYLCTLNYVLTWVGTNNILQLDLNIALM